MNARFIILVLCFALVGCAATKEAVDDYSACMANAQCAQEVNAVRSHTYVATQTATATSSVPSVADVVAFVISSVVSFGVGSWHGRKLKKG